MSMSSYDLSMTGPSEKTKNHFDELNHRFSDLLVNSHLISDDNSEDSDKLFKDLKSCKNVTFTRSRSYFDDDILLFPLTPARTIEKHSLLTSDEEEANLQDDVNQSSRISLYSGPRSPLKVHTLNSLSTPKPTKRFAGKDISSILCFSTPGSEKSRLKSKSKIFDPDNRNKENMNTNRSIILSPEHNHSSLSLTMGPLTCTNSSGMVKTPMNKSNKTVLQTSTPLNKALTPNMSFKTPVSNKTTKSQMSALKRHSIDKAVASARQEFEEMVRAIKLKKSVLKSKQKEGTNSILDGKCDTPENSTARYSLFCTPTTTSYTPHVSGSVKTSAAREEPNNHSSLTGVKKLYKQNEEQTPVSKKTSLNLINSINKDKTLLDDDDDDIPCTLPVTSILLRNVVAYVEVRCGRDDLSEGTKAELESLGARVEKNFTRKVTHCFFHGGRMSTYRKAIEWKVPLVSTLWIEACKAELQMVPIKGYAPHGLQKYREELPLYKLKTKGLRRAVTDSKIRQKPWKEEELSKKPTLGGTIKLLPPAPTFKKVDTVDESHKIIDALHSVAGDLRKATDQFEKILTSPELQKKNKEKKKSDIASKTDKAANTSDCRRKRNKKLVFGSSSDDDNKNGETLSVNPVCNETTDISSKISDVNNSGIRVSYDSDDLLAYAKKQAGNLRSSAPPRLLTSRKCKKLFSSCKEPEKKNNGETTSGTKVRGDENVNKVSTNSRTTRRSNIQPENNAKINEIEKSSKKQTQTKKRKLLLPSQVIADFEQDSGECTPPASPKCPYKPTPNKKPRTGLAVKSKIVRTIASVRVTSDCDSDDSLTRAARRESSALFVKKDKKTIPQKTTPTIVCTSVCRSDEDVVKSIVAQLGTFAVEATVSERTTHVVTPVARRTINLLKGIVRGCWVMNMQWVYKSLEVGQWLPEERFELTNFSPAVKLARCDRQAFGPEFGLELFTGLGPFYVCRATVPPARDLAELLRLGGGSVVSNARAAKIVIGSTPPLSPCGRTVPLVVKEKWILDCITRLTKLSVNDYIAVVDSEP